MQHSNTTEKMISRKSLAWHEEGQGRKGDKRNKRQRTSEKRKIESENFYC